MPIVRVKPNQWAFEPGQVDERFRYLWGNVLLAIPFWHGATTQAAWIKGKRWLNLTRNNTPTAGVYSAGYGVDFTNTEVDNYTIAADDLPANFPCKVDDQPYTALAYMNVDVLAGGHDHNTLMYSDTSSTTTYLLYINSTGGVGANVGTNLTSSLSLAVGEIALVGSAWDGATSSVIAKGRYNGTTAVAALGTSPGPLNIGTRGGSPITTRSLDGRLYTVYIFDRMLRDQEIALINADPFGLWRYQWPIVVSVPADGGLSATVGKADATAAAYDVTAVPGAVTVTVGLADATAAGLTVTAVPGAITATVGLADATAAGLDIVANQAIGLDAANATAAGLGITAVPGAISIAVDLADATAAALDITTQQTIGVASASAAASADDITAVPGAISIAVGFADATAAANNVTASLEGDLTADVGTANATATGLTITPVPGAITVAVGSASASAAGYDLLTHMQIAVGLANASAAGYAPAAVPGVVSAALGRANATATANNVSIEGAVAELGTVMLSDGLVYTVVVSDAAVYRVTLEDSGE